MRVALDTSVIRTEVHAPSRQDGPFAELTPLRERGVKFSVAVSSFLELSIQLLEERIKWSDWRRVRDRVADLIDPTQPIVDGAEETHLVRREARRASYLSRMRGAPPAALWRSLLRADELADFTTPFVSTTPLGAEVVVRVSLEGLVAIADARKADWIDYIERQTERMRAIRNLLANSPQLDAGELSVKKIVRIADALARSPAREALPNALQLDAEIRFMEIAVRQKGYNVRKHANDVLDLHLLNALLVAEFVCTLDLRLIRHIRSVENVRNVDVLTPSELRQHLS